MTSIQSFTMPPALERSDSQAMSLPPFSFANLSSSETLQDLAVRFVLNCPEEDKSAAHRIMFQIEEAYWYYEDFVREQNPYLEPVKLPRFTQILYDAVPELSRYCKDFQTALAEFKQYKRSIPVRGVIVLNEGLDKVLMVRPYKRPVWGFPRGKINKEEDDRVCAVREVLEETGFDATEYLDGDHYVEREVQGKNFRFYYASGVPESTIFETRTRKEIDEIAWIPLSELRSNTSRSKFVITLMFLSSIDKFVRKKKNYLTRLSQAESRALKRLLAAPEPSSLHNDEESAKQLLGMLKPTPQEQEQAQLQLQQTQPGAGQVNVQHDQAAAATATPPAQAPPTEQDRQVLLNLLKESTPQIETATNAAQDAAAVQNAEVESAKHILALLKKEMTASKKVNAPHVIPPNAESPAVPAVSRPVLPPNSMLEQLVSSRKKTPVHKVSSAPKHKPVLSKNRFLNVLNSVPAPPVRETKLIDLLNPPTSSTPASSPIKKHPETNPLMDLLKSDSDDAAAPAAATATSAASASASATSEPAAAESTKESENNPLMNLLKGGSDNLKPAPSAAPAAAAPAEPKEPTPVYREPSLLAMLQPTNVKAQQAKTEAAEPIKLSPPPPQKQQRQQQQQKKKQEINQTKLPKSQIKEGKNSKHQAAANKADEHELQIPSSVARLREISLKKETPRAVSPSKVMNDEALLKLLSASKTDIVGRPKEQQPKEEVLQNASDDLMHLLRPSTPQTSYQEKANAAAIATAEGLLRLLESVPGNNTANKPTGQHEHDTQSIATGAKAEAGVSEQNPNETTASNELMSLLKSEPPQDSKTAVDSHETKVQSTNELMNLLKLGNSNNNAPKPPLTRRQPEAEKYTSSSGPNELMNLLNPTDKKLQDRSDESSALMKLLNPVNEAGAIDSPKEKHSESTSAPPSNKYKHSEKPQRKSAKSMNSTDQSNTAEKSKLSKNKGKSIVKKAKPQDDRGSSQDSKNKSSNLKKANERTQSESGSKQTKAEQSLSKAQDGEFRGTQDVHNRDSLHRSVTADSDDVDTPRSTRSQTPVDSVSPSSSSNPLLSLLQESLSTEQTGARSQPRPRAGSEEKQSSFSLLNLLGLKSHSERTMPIVPKSP